MGKIFKWTVSVWLGFMVLSIFVWLMQGAQAATPAPQATPNPAVAATPSAIGNNDLIPPTEYHAFLGGSLGIATANNDVGTGLGWGGEFAFFPHMNFGVGLTYRGAHNGTPTTHFYALEGLARPVPPIYVGFMLGGANVSNGGANTGSALGFGGKAGWDIALGSSLFTIGPTIDVLFFKPGPVSITEVNIEALLKLWL
jgi:hypothetical protein